MNKNTAAPRPDRREDEPARGGAGEPVPPELRAAIVVPADPPPPSNGERSASEKGFLLPLVRRGLDDGLGLLVAATAFFLVRQLVLEPYTSWIKTLSATHASEIAHGSAAILVILVGALVDVTASRIARRRARRDVAALRQRVDALTIECNNLRAENSAEKSRSIEARRARIHGKRVVFSYRIDPDNVCTISRRYEGVTADPAHGPLIIPYALDFGYARDAEILSVSIEGGGFARFRKAWTPEHRIAWQEAIEFVGREHGREHGPVDVEVVARVKNAFAQDSDAARARARTGIELGRDFQEWNIGGTSWDEMVAAFSWPAERNVRNPLLQYARSLSSVDLADWIAVRPGPRPGCDVRAPAVLYADGNHWGLELRQVTPPMRALLTWSVLP